MDSFSQLLCLHPMRTALDARCQLRGTWRMQNPASAPGIAPYHLILEGQCHLDGPGHVATPLKAGDMLMLPRGHQHNLYTSNNDNGLPIYECSSTGPISLMCNDGVGPVTEVLCGQFNYNGMASNALMAALPDIVLVRTADSLDFTGLSVLAAMLRDETAQNRPGAYAVISHLASTLFAMLIRTWLEQSQPVPGLFALLAEPRLSKALQIILDQPEQNITVEMLAQSCHMSRATFARMFRRVAGTSPGDILLQIRMAQAAIYLANEKQTIADIGEQVGYQSEAAFNRAFKRYLGIGPGQYRAQLKTGKMSVN